MRIIYSKNSGDRKKSLQIRTKIIEDRGGRYVLKEAVYEEGRQHILNIYKNYRLLQGIYEKAEVNKADLKDDKLYLEYVDGKEFTVFLLEALKEDKLGKFFSLLDVYKDILVGNEKNIAAFEKTENFKKIFGNISGLEGCRALKIANVDCIPDNILVKGDQYTIIDYEWVFDFPIPVDFVLYRNISDMYAQYRSEFDHRIKFENLLGLLGVEIALDKLEEMNQNFYYYIAHNGDEEESMVHIKQKYLRENVFQSDMLKRLENAEREKKEYYERIQESAEKISELRNSNENLTKENQAVREERDSLAKLSEERLLEIKLRDSIIADREMHLSSLRDMEREYNSIVSSKTWRVAFKLKKILNRILPKDSIRRAFLKPFFLCAKKSYRFFKKVSGSELKAYEKLEFPVQEEPEVSIIIPVYNQFEYTYQCLKSILEYTEDISYEVIIADDRSTDLTRKIKKIVGNISVITTQQNLRFLGNCNNAARHARGKYILFLNNDTRVTEKWLDTLLEVMQDEKVGVVGSKLIYPNGVLQEAGGIVWKDASAWNFGKMQDASKAEFNYVRETDYVSGAALLIRKQLWDEIGGFDTRYAPAYYEDTDLCFEARKHGYKVMLQPFSVVIHFEGMSNGTDTSAGVKAYQEVNQKKFLEKWKETLKATHFFNGEEVFLARDRSKNKKHLLFIDHYVPHFDQDAGSRCVYSYICLMVEMGIRVTFMGDNFYPHQPYTEILQKKGVEVLYGSEYAVHKFDWIREHAKYFDYVYTCRAHITEKYIDCLKSCIKGKIFYFNSDMAHIREYREYKITGEVKHLEAARKIEKMEMSISEKADILHVVGSYEQGILQEKFPGKPVRNIPVYVFDEIKEVTKNIKESKDLLFVGGFAHPPNADGVKWFVKEILPTILESIPEIKFYIVGSKPTDEILQLADDHIIVTGFVSDEELNRYYESCRICVAPLRFGAGVKGKIIEALYHQIPVVTTSIGAEGLSHKENAMIIEDDAAEFAKKVTELYQDTYECRQMQENSKVFINRYFTKQVAREILQMDIK